MRQASREQCADRKDEGGENGGSNNDERERGGKKAKGLTVAERRRIIAHANDYSDTVRFG